MENYSTRIFMLYKIYKNTTRHAWSIKVKNKVVSHNHRVIVSDPVFTCSQKTIQRIRRTKRKTPCAYVCGRIIDCGFPDEITEFLACLSSSLEEVVFNPYQFTSFVFEKTKGPVINAKYCIMIYPKVFVINAN